MEFIRKTVKIGNSSGVILPRSLLGSEVKIIVINPPVSIKKETIRLLSDYFFDISGVYITNKNPLEILAVSTKIKKIIKKENMKVSVVPLAVIRRDIKENEILRYKLALAETILNKTLLDDLRSEIKNLA